MDDQQSPADSGDSEILTKFRNFLNKYQNQGKIVPTVQVSATGTIAPLEDQRKPFKFEEIPLLTDVVVLQPAVIYPQPARLTPVRQILDAALTEAKIEMNDADRKKLGNALEKRLTGLLKKK